MQNNLNAPRNPLESAADQLRSLCADRDPGLAPFNVGSMNRMIVHIASINSSVLTSLRDHVNASKRLNDFATTLVRIADGAGQQHEELAQKMNSVADTLRGASEELKDANAIPGWQAVAKPVKQPVQ